MNLHTAVLRAPTVRTAHDFQWAEADQPTPGAVVRVRVTHTTTARGVDHWTVDVWMEGGTTGSLDALSELHALTLCKMLMPSLRYRLP